MCQIRKTIKENQLLTTGDKVVVGFSGGPDSLTLLHALNAIKDEWPISLVAVHINHMLRGEFADADEQFCQSFCAQNHIPCYTFKVDVSSLSQINNISFEEAGRIVRYEKFEEVRHIEQATKIAVAQNKNDVTETFLMNLLRGSGIDGLASIEYMRDQQIIRPLLDVDRQSIESYCLENGLEPRRDHTNDENDYLRNRIRNELIPHLSTHYNPSFQDAIQRTVQIMKEEKAFWSDYQKELFQTYCRQTQVGIQLDYDKMKTKSKAEQRQLIRHCIEILRGDLKNISFDIIEQIMLLNRSGAYCQLDSRHRVIRTYGALIFQEYPSTDSSNACTMMGDPCDERIYTKVIPIEERNRYQYSATCVAIDADCILGNLEVRYRRQGDAFVPLGMKGNKKIKAFFIDEKIPNVERDKIPLVCDEEKIIWVKDMRISEQCKITEKTKNIMIISFRELVESR